MSYSAKIVTTLFHLMFCVLIFDENEKSKINHLSNQ